MQNESEPTFWTALFDVSFTQFVSVQLVRILYILAIFVALVLAVIGVFSAFTQGFWTGILGLLFAPVFLIAYILFARVWLEFVVVIFRIADHAGHIAENTRTRGTEPAYRG